MAFSGVDNVHLHLILNNVHILTIKLSKTFFVIKYLRKNELITYLK